ncbi:hypothetical protein GCM10027449_18490 [Sinomonas notoginsengisoli]|uniref:hypothetical protein n=1 Tax=Sinomonas notoginsengisoli TaxID=1457311 RepID=UPI001F449551|nr:hypothetical protein [Sinomonas notoginsengisoli]
MTATQTMNDILVLQGVYLYEATAVRYDGVAWSEPMDLSISIENGTAILDDGMVEARSVCSFRVKNGDDDFALLISQYRARFNVTGSSDNIDLSEGSPLGADVNAWMLNYIYPYHRQLISDMNSRMALPPFPLPTFDGRQFQGMQSSN